MLAFFYGDYRHDLSPEVSKDFNLMTIEIFEYLLLQLNKFSNFSCNIDYIESCPASSHMERKSLELQSQLLNISLRYFKCALIYIGIDAFYIQ